jgi:hypothetical protein
MNGRYKSYTSPAGKTFNSLSTAANSIDLGEHERVMVSTSPAPQAAQKAGSRSTRSGLEKSGPGRKVRATAPVATLVKLLINLALS